MNKDPYHRRVKEVLSKDVVSVSAQDTLEEALALMAENGVMALPVVNAKGACEGILSATDLLLLTRHIDEELRDLGRDGDFSHQALIDKVSERDMARHTVSEYMTRSVATVTEEATISETAAAMLRYKVHRIPVVDNRGRLHGIVSTMDVLAAFLDGHKM